MPNQLDFVSIIKKSNIDFDGHMISHTVVCKDGAQKLLVILLPCDKPLILKAEKAKRIEIVSGKCNVQIGNRWNFELFHAGQSFHVPPNCVYQILCEEVLDYICHFEK